MRVKQISVSPLVHRGQRARPVPMSKRRAVRVP